VDIAEVADEPFLLLKDGHCFRDDVLRICRRSRMNQHVVFEAGEFDTLIAMGEAGAGVTLIRKWQPAYFGVPKWDCSGSDPQPTRTVGLVRSKGKLLTPAARAFMDVLVSTRRARGGG
jgi:LysR family hydrogen peroxide-inducible transcriptional activator